jgi:hypothetical protein
MHTSRNDPPSEYKMTRRSLLKQTLRLSAGFALAHSAGVSQESTTLSLRLNKTPPVPLSANFIGLGYEMSSVAQPGLLRVANHRYVKLIRTLGPSGVLRVGGIVANYTRYEPNGTVVAQPTNTLISRATLEDFAAFLRRIGWTAIWSVNFAQGTIGEAVAEARAVAEILGSHLLSLEIGNEVDNYKRSQPFRSPTYNYEDYRREYTEWHTAIAKAVPYIRFAAPDTAQAFEWVERMAGDAKGDVQLLTTHYYRNGQANGSVEQLLTPDQHLHEMLTRLQTASRQSGIPWRMCETNSFSGGGRPGVSDTFVGALWTLDFMLLLAQYGCSGVNMETGVNQLGFISSYSPIQDNGKGMNSAAVPYYGMLAFAKAAEGCSQVIPVEVEAQGIDVTVYALGTRNKPLSVIVINRDRTRDATISLHETGIVRASTLSLVAPSPESTSDITFGGAAVDAEGKWTAKRAEIVQSGMISAPPMSALVIRSAD